jgi:ankyrin repeat protein
MAEGAMNDRQTAYVDDEFFTAARSGDLPRVRELIAAGVNVNAREPGDNTTAMHWAAAAGHASIVEALAEAGGDVVGSGDDHEIEVIGWATCWEGCDDDAHRKVVDILIAHGARHHIFSAIAMNLGEQVREIVARDRSALERRMSRNESHQTPLHFAVRMNRPVMLALLLELGADPLITDGFGNPPLLYAMSPDVDQPVVEAIARRSGSGETVFDLLALLATGETERADLLIKRKPELLDSGALHLMAKRGDAETVDWLLSRGANPNAKWSHFGASVTPLHMVAFSGSAAVAKSLLDAGADRSIKDSMHDGDAIGWAEHFGRIELRDLLHKR